MLGLLFAFASCEKEKNYTCKCIAVHEKFPAQEAGTYAINGKKNDAINECNSYGKKITGTRYQQQTVGVCKIQ